MNRRRFARIKKIIKHISNTEPDLFQFHPGYDERIVNIGSALDEGMFQVFFALLMNGHYKCNYNAFPRFIYDYVAKLGNIKIVIYPLQNKSDYTSASVKSGFELIYKTRVVLRQDFPNVEVLNTPFFNPEERAGANYIMVDDFVGTGKSAARCALEQRGEGHRPAQTRVVCVTAMTQAAYNLYDDGISCYSMYKIDSVFADLKCEFDEETARNLYKALADCTNTKAIWGFDRSEAMAVMMRTPDNTLGAFWSEFEMPTISPAIFSR